VEALADTYRRRGTQRFEYCLVSINAKNNQHVDAGHDRETLSVLEDTTHKITGQPQPLRVLPDHLNKKEFEALHK